MNVNVENVCLDWHSQPMTGSTKFVVGAYIEELRARAGLTMQDLAKSAGYAAPSSIQTHTRSESDRLQPKVAKKFAKALFGKGTPPINLEDLARLIGASLKGPFAITDSAIRNILELEGETESSAQTYIEPAEAGRLPIMGSAHASFWMPAQPSEDEPLDWLTIPFMSTRPLPNQYALKIIGPSINRVAKDGHFAICSKYGEGVGALPEGKFVHAERERNGEYEWTLKKVKWSASGASLWPDSDDKEHQAPLELGALGDRVTIKGIVVGWYRPA